MRLAVCLVATAITVLAGACSSSGGAPAVKSVLADALRHVADNATNREYVEFGRPQATLAANGGFEANGPYARAIGYGFSDFWGVGRTVADRLGFDVRSASYALTVGEPPHQGFLVSGVAAAATARKLTALGATPSPSAGGVVYRFRADDVISTHDRLYRAFPGVLDKLDVMRVDGADLRFGASAADVTATRAPGPGLLGNPAYADIASCLGDPLGAIVTDRLPSPGGPGGGIPPSGLPKPSVGVQAVGVGVSGAKGAPPTEQMCVRADSADHAQRIAATVKTVLASGTSRYSGEMWSTLLPDASVSVDGSTVRLTAHPAGRPGGVLLRGVRSSDLPGVSG